MASRMRCSTNASSKDSRRVRRLRSRSQSRLVRQRQYGRGTCHDAWLYPEATRAAVESYNAAVEAGEPDEVGRVDGRNVLSPPFYGTEVTGSLFHTQGGLVVDEHARVLREDGSTVDNLYAGGGTATGISGHGADGYLSGNGLTTAMGLGRLAGLHAIQTLGE